MADKTYKELINETIEMCTDILLKKKGVNLEVFGRDKCG